jgi:hypothetical protein
MAHRLGLDWVENERHGYFRKGENTLFKPKTMKITKEFFIKKQK